MENRFADCKSVVAMVVRRDKLAGEIDAGARDHHPSEVSANRRRLNAEYADQMKTLFNRTSQN